jgi:uncharacterized protein
MDLGAIEQFVRDKLRGEATGHDFHHCFRVRRTAELIARSERGCDPVVVGCASLLHDIPDPKICSDVEQATRDIVRVMQENGIDSRRIDHVVLIIGTLSFKGANVETPMATLEGKVVQDADRLDAMGAIGIARCFAYGGSRRRPIYDPREPVVMHSSEEEYRAAPGSSVGHFHEKLLLLRNRMQTETGKAIARARHDYMVGFLAQFMDEWEGKDIERASS